MLTILTLQYPYKAANAQNKLLSACFTKHFWRLFFILLFIGAGYNCTQAQTTAPDSRLLESGWPIFNSYYIDQPYVIKLANSTWICFYTKSDSAEGSADMRVGVSISSDKGKTWVAQSDLDSATSSYADPFLASNGRMYAFYEYNTNHVSYTNAGAKVFYLVGDMVYKYSDDYGHTWSDRQHINIPYTHYDSINIFHGQYQLWWQICKPIVGLDGQMYMSFTKNTQVNDTHEGWAINSPNINTETDPAKLIFNFYPSNTPYGISNPVMGNVQEEHNIVQLNNGTFYMVFRTTQGYIGQTSSIDSCRTWSLPQVLRYGYGDTIRNTRACPRLFKCANGKYLLWYENNSYVSGHRNPSWISGGVEQNGTINWSQPEILLYSQSALVTLLVSYPDLVEDNGNYYITETNKKNARIHLIDTALLNRLWQQGASKIPVTAGLIVDWDNKKIKDSTGIIKPLENKTTSLYWKGITIEMQANKDSLTPGRMLVPIISGNLCCGYESLINVLVRQNGNIGVDLYYGGTPPNTLDLSWDCDAKFLLPGTNTITIAIDSFSRVLSFMVNGILVKGNSSQLQGWTKVPLNWQSQLIKYVGLTSGASCLKRLKIFNYALNTGQQIQDYLSFNAPTATISGSKTTCLNASPPNVTFQGFYGTAPYTFTYAINGGANKTITTTTGDFATVAVPVNTTGSFTYSLVSITDNSGVSQNQSGSATVTINTPSTSFSTVAVCSNLLPYVWNGNSYYTGGTYSVHLINALGCDSAATLVLTVNQPTASSTAITVSTANLPYNWNGVSCAAAGIYVAHLGNAAGCDSTATLLLSTKDAYSSAQTVLICSTDLPYQGNANYAQAGTYSAHHQATGGNDSSATLILSVIQATSSTTNINICSSVLPYVWNGNSYSQAGSYTVHLNNSAGCDSAATLILTVNNNPAISSSGATTLCNGDTASVNINASGGALPYSGTGVFKQLFSSGTVIYTITDANGCKATTAVAVSQPASFTVAASVPAAGKVCYGQTTILTASASGGTAPYTYTIAAPNNYQATPAFTVSAGNYLVTAKDANGCLSVSPQLSVVQPAALAVSSTVTTTSCTNTVTLMASGGYGSYQYSIDSINYQTGNVFAGLPGGTYPFIVKDANGCTVHKDVNSSTLFGVYQATNTQACYGLTAYTYVNPRGGKTPYLYSLDGVNYQTNNWYKLTPGNYSITIKDSTGCTYTTNSLTITQPATPVSVNTIVNATACNNDSIIASGSGGGLGVPFTYGINGGALQASNIFANLGAGTYNIQATDKNGCNGYKSVTVAKLAQSVAVSASISSPVCAGTKVIFTAKASIAGTAPAYQWYKNNNLAGTNSDTYIDSALNNNDSVWCVLTSTAGCLAASNAKSNVVKYGVTLKLAPSVTISANSGNGVCAGTRVNFTAIAVNGGVIPAYQWFKNNTAVSSNTNTYADSLLNNNDSVWCILTSSIGCVTANTVKSNVKVATVNQPTASNTTVSVCAASLPYRWNGSAYNATGSYTVHFTNAKGCDSLATLLLSVNQATASTTYTTVCSTALPFSWNGNNYNAPGTYTIHLTNIVGCDSAATLVLIVKQATTSTTYTTLCSTALPFSWNGYNYNATGSYTTHLTNAVGCDSAATLVLTVNLPTTSNTIAKVCAANLPYSWNGNNYNAQGSYTIHLTNAVGCDSTATLVLTVNQATASTTDTTVCSTALPFNWNGGNYNTTGNYTIHLTNAAGCDSAATLVLTVNQATTSTTDTTVCSTALPFNWNGGNYNTTGNYTIYLTNAVGCDSTATLVLTVNQATASTTDTTVCSTALPFNWNGGNYNTTGNYTIHLTNAAGCDSAATLVLTVNQATTSTTDTTVCSTALPFNWNGGNYNTTGNYTIYLTNAVGCDSTATLVLTVNQATASTTDTTVCSTALPFNWNGGNYNTTGNYTIHLTNAAGCDSAATLMLTVNQATTSTTDTTVCSTALPFSWNGDNYNATGNYTIHLTNAAGCDSAATLMLTVNQATTSTTDTTVCSTALPFSWNGDNYNATGNYTIHLTNAAGCDSAATLVLTVNQATTSTTDTTVCSTALPFSWNGGNYNATGNYTIHLTNAAGCDSAATLMLTVNQATTSTTDTTVCSTALPFNWNGGNYNTTGNYTIHLTNAAGCDSAATLVLTVNQATTSTIDTTVCSTALPFNWNGGNYNTTGNYTIHLTNAAGCDSAATLVLTVNLATASTTDTTVCSTALPFNWNGGNYNTTGNYTIHLTNAAGCDSAATLVLTVNQATASTTDTTVCSTALPFNWNGGNYNATGNYTIHLTNAAGCDSAATLVLTVNQATTSTTDTTVCSTALPFSWNGNNYNATGNYTIHLTNAAGCDSAATLVLTVNQATASTTYTTVCSTALPFSWNGNNYNATGNYTIHLTNAAGCDSAATLVLTVNQATASTTYTTVCSTALPFSWNGDNYNATGSYTTHLTNAVGCDSAATLVLTVNQATTSTTNTTVCSTALPFGWNGNNYNAQGRYTIHLTNAAGCDSAVTLVLIVNQATTSTTDTTVCSTALPFSWNGNNYNATGTYTVHLTNAVGCDSAATLVLTVNQATTSTTDTTVCSTALPFNWNGGNYTIAGSYTVHMVNAAGCDSAATLILSIKQASSSVTNVSVCPVALPYTWNGNKYNIAGSYTIHLTNAAGCDSMAILALTVKQATASNTVVNICTLALPYTWNGNNYNSAGSYVIHLINAAGCDSTATLILSVNANPVINISSTPILCNGSGTTVFVTASGGTAPYSGAGSFAQTAANGTVTYTITDAKGCRASAPVTLSQPPALVATMPANAKVCYGTSSPITASVSGGTAPYTYTITAPNNYQASPVFTVYAGTYRVAVKDANGCVVLTSPVVVTQPSAQLTLTATPTASCVNNTITLLAAGGFGGYQYSIDSVNYQASNVFTGLAAGTYTCIVKDANGCTAKTIINTVSLTGIYTSANTQACYGLTAYTYVNPKFGKTPYLYSLDGVNYQTNNWFKLTPGTYSITIKDSTGCTYTTNSLTVTQPATPVSVSTIVNATACNNDSITATASGGYGGPFNYGINGAALQASNIFATLGAGTYNIQATDKNGCNGYKSVTIAKLVQSVAVSASVLSPVCAGTRVTFTATAYITGTAPAYQWYKNNTAVGINSSVYTDSLLNSNDSVWCVLTSSAACITGSTTKSNVLKYSVTPVVVPFISITANTASTICTGTKVTLTAAAVNAGSVPVYQWFKNNTVVGANSNIYTDSLLNNNDSIWCVVTSNAACVTASTARSNTLKYTVNQFITPAVTVTTSVAGTVCAGTKVTFTAAAVNGGAAPAFQWYKNNTATGVNSAAYTDSLLNNNDSVWCVVTSNAACLTVNAAKSNITRVLVNANPVINISSTPILCNGSGTTVFVTASGGTAPYSGAGSFAQTAANGTVTYTITDAKGCRASAPVTLSQPPALVATMPANAKVCYGTSSPITASVSGGTAPYTYTITAPNNYQASPVFTVYAGTYRVAVKDANGCVVLTSPVVVTQPSAQLTLTATPTASCVNNTITLLAAGGFGGYQYSIDSVNYQASNIFTGLAAGTYTCIVKDANGCTAKTIINTVSLTGIYTSANTQACYGLTAYTYVNPKFGKTPYLYSLDGVNYQTNNWFKLTPGTYSITIKDSTGCTYTTNSLTVTQPATPVSVSTIVNATACNNDSITATASGGYGGPFNYGINGAALQASNIFATLGAGTYNIQATDKNGCNGYKSVTIAKLVQSVAVSASVLSPVCAGTRVTFTATAYITGTAPAYQWYKNNTAVGINSSVYTDSLLNSNDSVWCVLTSSAACITGSTTKSNVLKYSVTPVVVPFISITANTASTICTGTKVTLTAAAVNAGSVPVYQWFKNNTVVGANSNIYTDSLLNNNDSIWCVVTSNAACVTAPSVYSNKMNFTVNTPTAPGAITGPLTVNINQTSVSYSISTVTGATGYTWSVPANAAIASGQGTTAIIVNWGSTPGNVTVTANGSCGKSVPASIAVVIASSLQHNNGADKTVKPFVIDTPQIKTKLIRVYPNPATDIIMIEFTSATNQKVEVQMLNELGQILESRPGRAIKGHNTMAFEIAKLASSMYYLRLVDQQHKQQTLRFIKAK